MADFIPKMPPLFQTSLAAPLAQSAQATFDIASPLMLNRVALSGLVGISVDVGTPTPEYFLGTLAGVTITILVRGIDPLNISQNDPTLQYEHRRGAVVKITDYIGIQQMGRLLNGTDFFQNILAYLTHPSFTPGSFQIPDVKYVDDSGASIIAQIEALIQQFILTNTGGGIGKPQTFSTFNINNYVVPKTGYTSVNGAVFNYKTASNGHLFAIQVPGYNQQIRDYQLDWSTAVDVISYVIDGTNLYLLLTDGTAYRVYQYDITALGSGGTVCTFSGQTLGTQAGVTMTKGQSTTGGAVNIYFNFDSGNSANDYRMAKFSVLGSAFTYVSSTNLGATLGVASNFLVDSAGNYYAFSSSFVVRNYNSSGVIQYTTDAYQILDFVLNWSDTVYAVSSEASNYVLLDLLGTSSSFDSSDTINKVAANDLLAKDAVGISDMVGESVDLFDRSAFSHSIPNFTPRRGGGVQIATDKTFLVYEDSSTGKMMGVVVNTTKYGMQFNPDTPAQIIASGSYVSDNWDTVAIGNETSLTLSSQVGSFTVGDTVTQGLASGTVSSVGVLSLVLTGVSTENPFTTGPITNGSSTAVVATADSSQYVSIAYQLSTSVLCVIVKITGNTFTVGTPVTAYTDSGQTNIIRMQLVDNLKILIASNGTTRSNYIIGTIIGTVPTFGTKQSDTTNFVNVFTSLAIFELTRLATGVIVQVGIIVVDSSQNKTPGARVLTFTGTVINFGTSNTSIGAVFAIGDKFEYNMGGKEKISATRGVSVFSYVENNITGTSERIFFEISGTTVTGISRGQLGGANSFGDGANVWYNASRLKTFIFQTYEDDGTTTYPATQFNYSGGSSVDDQGIASHNTIFSGMLIVVDDYIVAVTTGSYLMSGISTLSSLGYISKDVSAGSNAKVQIHGEIITHETDLSIGNLYEMGSNGSLSQGVDSILNAGRAVSSTNVVL